MSITYRLKLVFFLILLFSSCTTNRLNELEQNINKLDYNHENYSISLDTISFFEWDEVVIASGFKVRLFLCEHPNHRALPIEVDFNPVKTKSSRFVSGGANQYKCTRL